MDQEKKIYYTEMQKRNTGNLIRRSRYYQAQLDVSFDIFGRGLYRYTFEGVCKECPDLKMEDGFVRIFINTKGKNRKNFSKEFLDFMTYLTSSTDETAENTKSKRIKIAPGIFLKKIDYEAIGEKAYRNKAIKQVLDGSIPITISSPAKRSGVRLSVLFR